MKLNIEVDFSEIIIDKGYDENGEYSNSLKEEIQNAIINTVKLQVLARIEKSAIKAATEKAIEIVDSTYQEHAIKQVEDYVKDILENGTYSNDKTIKEILLNRIAYHSSEREMNDKIHKIAKEVHENLIKRYDLQFASAFVEKLSSANMLNENAYKLLGLEGK